MNFRTKIWSLPLSAAIVFVGSGIACVLTGIELNLWAAGLTAGATLLVLSTTAWVIGRDTWRELGGEPAGLRELVQKVADGDLDVQVPVEPGDTRSLNAAMAGMVQRLRGTVRSIRDATDSIATASSEIAAGNLDLSTRTEHTAANLQQTASSMEQLTGTVRQSADSAHQANQLAASAGNAAQRGGSIVSNVVTNMEEINTASRKINEIIGVIDGIAFQTNILALNAAVEAARAGEQGRGFAVVAAEVRSLAQRSAQAAKEIKTLISASSEKVESGARLVQDAGAAMQEIVTGVQRFTDIIGEISAATSEQAKGIDSVNQSVNHLDQMTQQNAALVEQSAASAGSLKDQAGRLSQAVSAFRVERAGSQAAQVIAKVRTTAHVATSKPAAAPRVIAAPKRVSLPAPSASTPRAAPAAKPSAAPPASAASKPPSDDWETF
jgi:methyl-accepting chemotaxis protein